MNTSSVLYEPEIIISYFISYVTSLHDTPVVVYVYKINMITSVFGKKNLRE